MGVLHILLLLVLVADMKLECRRANRKAALPSDGLTMMGSDTRRMSPASWLRRGSCITNGEVVAASIVVKTVGSESTPAANGLPRSSDVDSCKGLPPFGAEGRNASFSTAQASTNASA